MKNRWLYLEEKRANILIPKIRYIYKSKNQGHDLRRGYFLNKYSFLGSTMSFRQFGYTTVALFNFSSIYD